MQLSSRHPDVADWDRKAVLPTQALSASAGLVAFLVLVGWLSQTTVLVTPFGRTAMTLPVAVIALFMVAGLLTMRTAKVSAACFIIVVVMSVWLGVEVRFGLDLGSATLGRTWSDLPPNADRSRGYAALTLLVLGLTGLLCLTARWVYAQIAASVAMVLGLVAALSGLYDRVAASESFSSPVSPYGAVVLGLLAVAAQFAVPGGIAQWITFGSDTGARHQRWLTAVGFIGVPLMGLIEIIGFNSERFSAAQGVALFVVFFMVLLYLVGVTAGLRFRRADRRQDDLLRQLRVANAALEDRVKQGSVQVQRQRTKLALLEERDRIARDLHDRVIQRIFAAGLQLGTLSRQAKKLTADDPEAKLPTQLNNLAAELDLAIRELRNSIFQLTSIDDHEDVEQVIHDIVSRSSRILGFMPKISVEGDLTEIRSDIVGDVASAIQEGMSNVAKHAHASGASLTFTAGDVLTVCIVDNGKGLPDPLPRSSGISNLRNRAEVLGGGASWEPNDPEGTVFTWWVPRSAEKSEFYGNATTP